MRAGGVSRSGRRWSLMLPAVLGFAAMQLTVAGHQFEHDSTAAESCAICVQLEQVDNASPLAVAGTLLVAPDVAPPIAAEDSTRSVSRAHYLSRAPPSI